MACRLILTMSPESWFFLLVFNSVYIFIFIFRPCGIETKVFCNIPPLKVIQSLSFQLKIGDFANIAFFWVFLGKHHS